MVSRATYPAVGGKSKIEPLNVIRSDISDGGVLRGQDLSARSAYKIEIEHPLILQADVTTLQDFYTAQKANTIITQQLADGNVYDCLLVSEPQVQDINAIRKTAKQKLTGRRYAAWDLSLITYDSITIDLSEEPTVEAMAFGDSGTKLYVVGWTNDRIYQYTLTTAWDLSTATYASKSLLVSGQELTARGLAFNSDGTKCYIVGQTSDRVYEYDLSTAWDISTGTYNANSFLVSGESGESRAMVFGNAGTKLYIGDGTANGIFEYDLSTAWDITSASYSTNFFDVGSEETNVQGVAISADGTKLYITGSTTHDIFEYDLGTAWDVSTAVYNAVTYAQAESTGVRDLVFKPDGVKLYVVDNAGPIYQYTVGLG